MINFAALCPHPPLIIPNVGKDRIQRVSDTIESMQTLADSFEQKDPQTTVVISPHAPLKSNEFLINDAKALQGNFRQFGDLSTELAFRNDLQLVEDIIQQFEQDEIPYTTRSLRKLDHGTLVPLYYLTQGKPNTQVLSLSYSNLSLKEHFQMGKALQRATSKNIALVASGDMSHRLTQGAPAGFSPQGEKFDQKLIELIKNKDVEGILNMEPELIKEAGECGYRSLVILLGALSNLEWKPKVLSYEGPFGVGYLVVNFHVDN